MPRQPDLSFAALERTAARLAPGTGSADVSRSPDGVSSQMYRVTRGSVAFYLRVADDDDEDLTIDAEVMARLAELGATVPDVVAVESKAAEVDRSVLLMSEVSGVALSHVTDVDVARDAARRAGRDAALLNGMAVDGFGFLDRTGKPWPPRGPIPTYADFAREFVPHDIDERHALLQGLFTDTDLAGIDDVIDRQTSRPLLTGALSHGDLDVTAIYVDGDRYSGLIDFGELRGGEPEFDRGHFVLHDQETNPIALASSFLAGHAEVTGERPDDDVVREVAILVGFRQLCRWLGRGDPRAFVTRFRVAQLRNLLERRPACAPRTDG